MEPKATGARASRKAPPPAKAGKRPPNSGEADSFKEVLKAKSSAPKAGQAGGTKGQTRKAQQAGRPVQVKGHSEADALGSAPAGKTQTSKARPPNDLKVDVYRLPNGTTKFEVKDLDYSRDKQFQTVQVGRNPRTKDLEITIADKDSRATYAYSDKALGGGDVVLDLGKGRADVVIRDHLKNRVAVVLEEGTVDANRAYFSVPERKNSRYRDEYVLNVVQRGPCGVLDVMGTTGPDRVIANSPYVNVNGNGGDDTVNIPGLSSPPGSCRKG